MTSDTPQPSRRVRNMKKRYSNASNAAAVVANAAAAAAQQQQEAEDRRKSFAVNFETIPSFRKLNDDLWPGEEGEVPQQQAEPQAQRQRRRDRQQRRSSSINQPSNTRRRRSSVTRSNNKSRSSKGGGEGKRGGIQEIQETKVVVSKCDDTSFFQDSTRSFVTETTASTSTHSSMDLDFFTTAHRSCPTELSFDEDDEDFFNNHSNSNSQLSESQKEINFQPANPPQRVSKYANLGTRMNRSLTTDDVFCSTTARSPSDLFETFAAVPTKGSKPKKTKDNSERASHSRTTTAQLLPPTSPKQHRPRRRSSLGDNSHCSGIPMPLASSIPLPFGKSEYAALGGGAQPEWSLKKLVGQNRKSLLQQRRQQQQQQEQMCSDFFGQP